MKKTFLLLVFGCSLLTLSSCTKQYENPLSSLTGERIHSLNLYFYPSTIRMINLGNDTSFYEATKNIRNLQFMSVNIADTANKDRYIAWETNQAYQKWDLIMNANFMGSDAAIYAPKDSEDVYFAKVQAEETVYLLWAEGKLNFNKLMAVSQNGLDLGPINNYLGNKDKEEKRRELREKSREEFRKLEKEDSLAVIK